MVKLDTPEQLDQLGFFQDGYSLLDIGCGIAPIAMYCIRNRKKISYYGVDTMIQRIATCKTMYKGFSDYQFQFIPVRSELYNPNGRIDPEKFTLDLADASRDAVICHSLFTHLDTEAVANRYMSEIKRVLRKGGLLWTTWFASPPNTESDGTRRTVYPLEFIHNELASFEPIYIHGGDSDAYHDQLEIACVKG